MFVGVEDFEKLPLKPPNSIQKETTFLKIGKFKIASKNNPFTAFLWLRSVDTGIRVPSPGPISQDRTGYQGTVLNLSHFTVLTQTFYSFFAQWWHFQSNFKHYLIHHVEILFLLQIQNLC